MSIEKDDSNKEIHINIPNKKALTKLKGSIKSKNRRKKHDGDVLVSESSRHGSSHKKVIYLIYRSRIRDLMK